MFTSSFVKGSNVTLNSPVSESNSIVASNSLSPCLTTITTSSSVMSLITVESVLFVNVIVAVASV